MSILELRVDIRNSEKFYVKHDSQTARWLALAAHRSYLGTNAQKRVITETIST